MPIRQRLVTYGIPSVAAATVALAALLTPWHTPPDAPSSPTPIADPTPVEQPARHAIDVVFAVDTTGSMGGLIEGAKRTVWSIATHIRQADPQADLRIGLVAYRDIGDVYVTKDFALTGDLDAVFAELSAYRADGGGDLPEDVGAALYDGVYNMAWRPSAKKLMFLVGDAPPAARGDVPTYDLTAREAGKRQIALNTVRCGFDPETERTWREIATLGHGEFSTIQEDGGVQQIATPYDKKLAEVSATIDHTTVIYGDTGVRGAYEGKMAATAAAPVAAMADRASWFAAGGKGESREHADVVTGVAAGTISVDSLAGDKLPPELQGMSKDALKSELAHRAVQRTQAEAELRDLATKRADYLRSRGPADGFDVKVKAAVDDELK